MSMKPIDVENTILLALRRSGEALTVPEIHRRVTTATGQGPTWREVASTCIRLERIALAAITAEREVDGVTQPAYQLTRYGLAASVPLSIRQHQDQRQPREVDHA